MPCTRCSDPRQCEDKCRQFGAEVGAPSVRYTNVPPWESDPAPAHSKSEYKRRVAQGDPNVTPPDGGPSAPAPQVSLPTVVFPASLVGAEAAGAYYRAEDVRRAYCVKGRQCEYNGGTCERSGCDSGCQATRMARERRADSDALGARGKTE